MIAPPVDIRYPLVVLATKYAPAADDATDDERVARIREKHLVVLVVDDDDGYRMQLRRKLEDYGVTVEDAESGALAIASLDERDFDLVLLDQWMEGMTGIEAYPKMRKCKGCKRVAFMSTDATVRKLAKEHRLPFFAKLNDDETLERILLDCDGRDGQ